MAINQNIKNSSCFSQMNDSKNKNVKFHSCVLGHSKFSSGLSKCALMYIVVPMYWFIKHLQVESHNFFPRRTFHSPQPYSLTHLYYNGKL